MIGYLRGMIRQIEVASILLDVGGVGYEVHMPLSAIQELPKEGEPLEIYTHTHVREDTQALYGFSQINDRNMFRTLITVSKVGPRIALAILSDLKVSELIGCVELNDTRPLEKVPGIGAKTAEKLLLELRDKVKQFPVDSTDDSGTEVAVGGTVRDATEALVELGFSNKEARQAVLAVRDSAETVTTEQLIRDALSSLSTISQ